MFTNKMGVLAGAAALNAQFELGWNPAEEEDLTDIPPAGDLKKNETWAYYGSLAVSIIGDKTTKYGNGVKVKFVQDGITKYFHGRVAVENSGNTTWNLDGRGVYSVANSVISDVYFSVMECPFGWPFSVKYVSEDGWNMFDAGVVSYGTSSTVTVPGDWTSRIQKGYGFFYKQSGAYTNDPASGSEIVLNMADTIGAVIGNKVLVSSSAGSEMTTITAVTSNVSITVAALALDHTTTNPLVTILKYASIIGVSYVDTSTVLTLAMGSDFSLIDGAIVGPRWTSNPQAAFGFPDFFNFATTWAASGSMTFGSLTINISKFKISGNKMEIIYKASGTTGGTAAANITSTYPSNLAPSGAADTYGGGAFVSDTAMYAGTYSCSTSVVNFKRYDSAVFGIGANRAVGAKVEYLWF